MSETTKYRVGILGCTGTVGQRFIQLLSTSSSKLFSIQGLGASERSAGVAYKNASRNWILSTPCPSTVAEMIIRPCQPSAFEDCDIIFSALDSSVAGDVESNFASAGFPVFSNSKNHRMDSLVPLVVPVVNPDHLGLIPAQRSEVLNNSRSKGFIVCNPNCSTTGLVVALKALNDSFGLDSFIVTTLQAVSGAGYPGVASLDILDNVVPFISGEEDKLEIEPSKILGVLSTKNGNNNNNNNNNNDSEANSIVSLDVKASASCNRVAVLDGHTECVSVKLKQPNITKQQVVSCFKNYKLPSSHHLPSLPQDFVPLKVFEDEYENRPQPKLDRDLGHGFTVSVGRVRACPVLDFKFVLLSHNTIIGAAGGAILNAELAVASGYIQKRK